MTDSIDSRIDRLHAAGIVDMHFDLLMDLYEKRKRANVLRDDFEAQFEAGGIGVVGAFDRHREYVVLLKDLDDPLGTPRRRCDEEGRIAGFAKLPDVGYPVGNTTIQFDGRLAADVPDTRRGSLGLFE
jgi:hypothetical protein